MRKSSTSDATARAWKVWSNGKFVIVLIQYDGTSWHSHYFGDFTSYKAGDAYNTCINVGIIATETTAPAAATFYIQLPAVSDGCFIQRTQAQTGTAVTGARCCPFPSSSTALQNWGTSGTLLYPATIGGGVFMSAILLFEGANLTYGPRGVMPALWAPWHNKPLVDGDTFSGVAGSALAGKTFEVANTGTTGQVFVETSDTWV
jgi:hypothetical protein